MQGLKPAITGKTGVMLGLWGLGAGSCVLGLAAPPPLGPHHGVGEQALDLLRVEPPSEDDDEVWPEGALDILADIGLPAAELQVIAGETDLYPDEQLQMVAQRCGFADEFAKLLDTIPQ